MRKEKQLAAEKKKLKKVEQMENRIGQARLYILSPTYALPLLCRLGLFILDS